jgi:hypothetical protein
MATRFYLNVQGWPPVRPTANAGWESNRLELSQAQRIMYPWHGSSFLTPSATGLDNQAAVHDVLMAQFISEPLAAQTISGTIRAVVQVNESNTAANMRSQMHAWVMAPDGSSRGTLTTFNTAALSSEWSTTVTSRFFPLGSTGTTVTNVNAVDGDRIVVELGARIHDTSATVYSGTLRIGDHRFNSPGTDWDLPSNQTDTTTTKNGWIEFSANLTFLTAPVAIVDDIADAVDAMPAAEGYILARAADISGFTTEADDPDDIDNYGSGSKGFTGWVKLVGPTGGARVRILATFGLGLDAMVFVFDGTPTSSSTAEAIYPDQVNFTDNPTLFIDVPDGDTKYVCIMPSGGSFQDFGVGDENVQLILSRAQPGEISDTIADAPDMLPAVQDTSESIFSPDVDFWTTEPDDPFHIEDFYSGSPNNRTGWAKMVVPSSGIKVNIDTYLPIDRAQGPFDTILMVFDEVPTVSSVPIAEADFSPDGSPPVGSIDPNWGGKAKITDLSLVSGTTYYIGVVAGAYDAEFWEHWQEGTGLQITVYRHLDGGTEVIEDFSVDAVIKQTWVSPLWSPNQPILVDSVSGSVNDATEMFLTIPGTAEEDDIFLVHASVDYEGVSQTTTVSLMDDGAAQLNLIALATTTVATNNHTLQSRWLRWDGVGDQIRIISTNSTAKAAVLTIWRNAGTPIHRSAGNSSSVTTGAKGTGSPQFLSNDPNYNQTSTWVGGWAGGRAGITTWTPTAPVAEIEDVSATASANLMVGYWTDFHDNFVDSRVATPSAAEFLLTHLTELVPATFAFNLKAFIIPGFDLNAYIQEATHTTHPRTGPHTGTHLSTAIVTSAMLGSLPAGTDLDTVIADLDAMLTDLENQA